VCTPSDHLSMHNNLYLLAERGLTHNSLVIEKEVLKCPRDSRLANAKFGSNMMSGDANEGQRKDVFLLSREDGMHWE
jgi:hypothetical protein